MVKCISVTTVEINWVKPGNLGNKTKNLLKISQNKARKMHIISIFVITERHELKRNWSLSN